MYNIIITRPLAPDVDRVIKFFNIEWGQTTKIIREYTKQGYSVEVKEVTQ